MTIPYSLTEDRQIMWPWPQTMSTGGDVIDIKLVGRRLVAAMEDAGAWGLTLAVLMICAWLVPLLAGHASVMRSPALGPAVEVFGRSSVVIWMGVVVALPIVGIGFNIPRLRSVVSTVTLTTWLWFICTAVLRDGWATAAAWIYAVPMIACVRAYYNSVRYHLDGAG